MRRWLITGAASGFGMAIARAALATGDAVVATDSRIVGLEAQLPGATVLPLDVRDAGEVRTTVAEVLRGGPVDVLVNNAGHAIFATQGEADLDGFAAMLDVNVLGPTRLTRALLPELRARRGVVVQLSSIAGRLVLPESGLYAASKHALEALSEALYVENGPAGLGVVLIEPGAFETGFSARAARSSPPRATTGAEVDWHAAWDDARVGMLSAPQAPELVAAAVLEAVATGSGRLQRVPVGVDAIRLLAARDALGPDAWIEALTARVRGLPALDPEAVLAATDAALRGPAFSAARAALAAGLLDPWMDSHPGAHARLLEATTAD